MNTSNWRTINIEYLESYITVEVPPTCDILQMKPTPPLPNIAEEIDYAFDHPIQSKTIEQMVSLHSKRAEELTVAIAVSDNTRPVPYHSTHAEDILSPLLSRLERAGIKKQNIKIIIGCGTHAPTSDQWKKRAFGDEVYENYRLIDHDCYSSDLVSIGKVMDIPVKINRDFIQADLHIITGLVETHFMVGASGGRKAICPGLINIEATQVFHGPEFMANPQADNLIFQDNPCHEFALEVARRTRVDFAVNVLLNSDFRICGITTGELEASHQKAVDQLRQFSQVTIDRTYDIVLTHGGKGALNHYQAIKGAWAALPAIKKGGYLILLAHNQDVEPIGSKYYKELLQRFREVGLGNFYPLISSPHWTFTPDQWEVQKWEQLFTRIGGFDHLIYCTVNIPPQLLANLPGVSGYQFIQGSQSDITTMLQEAIYYCVRQKENPTMAFLKEGPYIVLKNNKT